MSNLLDGCIALAPFLIYSMFIQFQCHVIKILLTASRASPGKCWCCFMFWKAASRHVKGDAHLVITFFCQQISHSSKTTLVFLVKVLAFFSCSYTNKPLQIYMTNYGKEMTVAVLQQSSSSSMKSFFTDKKILSTSNIFCGNLSSNSGEKTLTKTSSAYYCFCNISFIKLILFLYS